MAQFVKMVANSRWLGSCCVGNPGDSLQHVGLVLQDLSHRVCILGQHSFVRRREGGIQAPQHDQGQDARPYSCVLWALRSRSATDQMKPTLSAKPCIRERYRS